MSSQAERTRWTPAGGGRTGYTLPHSKPIQIARKKEFVTVSLVAVVGLLVSACLALLLPAAETLLNMPL
jgi:hypothetical protein